MHPTMFDFFSPLANPGVAARREQLTNFAVTCTEIYLLSICIIIYIYVYIYVRIIQQAECCNSCVVLRVGFNFFLPSSKG